MFLLLLSEYDNTWNARLFHTYLLIFPSGKHCHGMGRVEERFIFTSALLTQTTLQPADRIHFLQWRRSLFNTCTLSSQSNLRVMVTQQSRARVTSVFLNRVVTVEANRRLESSLSYSQRRSINKANMVRKCNVTVHQFYVKFVKPVLLLKQSDRCKEMAKLLWLPLKERFPANSQCI